MDKFRIDSHKLVFHPQRVGAWLKGELVYPIYMEVSLAGACNHRCVFCALDFMGYQQRKLDTGMFLKRLAEMGRLGLKSIMYAGEGEPLLHPDVVGITQATRAAGIDVAFTTNGVLLKPAVTEQILPHTEWIKVSFNAGTPESYARIHRCQAKDFHTVLANLKHAVEFRRQNRLSCTLGLQILLLPDVESEVDQLATLARDLGLDYLVVKPYSQHPQSITQTYKGVSYDNACRLKERLAAYTTDRFQCLVRLDSMRQWDQASKGYKHCNALPFWSYIDAGGNVWGCSMYLNDERFLYGNINTQTFQAIWDGDARRQSLEFVKHELDVCKCRINCRMEQINQYLWDLTEAPPPHVNFI
ncbi:MAG: radical SAM protein [Lentisphaerae bacterium RIFOXYB12_FULL_65_16]|nr:MAG: radical SAM protein [Lentisphaerae bacterium RIFOXYA12_64_32]OGV91279.1 MAG: radical SAM protein [Lentisphaerae bacterium RIFOXYB12_FULL_65_16]